MRPHKDIDRLLAKVAMGDRGAFLALYDRLAPRMLALLQDSLPDPGPTAPEVTAPKPAAPDNTAGQDVSRAEEMLVTCFERLWHESALYHDGETAGLSRIAALMGDTRRSAGPATSPAPPDETARIAKALAAPKGRRLRPAPQVLRRLQTRLFPGPRQGIGPALLPYVVGAILAAGLAWMASALGLLLP
jgi:hypothetical protein